MIFLCKDIVYLLGVFLLITLIKVITETEAATSSRQQIGDLTNPDNQNIQLTEPERIVEYKKRNYTWPLNNYNPNTPGWKQLMEYRFGQVSELDNSGERYEGYMQTIHTSFLVPNFTQYGFGLGRCPDELITTLRNAIWDALRTGNVREEHKACVINSPQLPLFIDRPDLTARVLKELLPYAEAWSGMELEPYRAYGFRLYRNDSQLTMHVDKMQTHIISFILHIDSSPDSEKWPIFIEDFNGNTHEVVLTSGDMLFYESSKCFHGRPRRLNGSWYSSIFVHYYPKYGWYEQNHELEAHYAVPPHWSNPPPAVKTHRRLEMIGTSMREPDCIDDWCNAQTSIKWSGPGIDGYWIAPTFEKFPLNVVTENKHHEEL